MAARIRLQRIGIAGERPSDCICFPTNEPPFFGTPFEMAIAAKLKCPLHGDRFPPQFFVYVSKWLRDKLWKHLWSHHTEQYRKAWHASFPPDLWPAEEEETDDRRTILRLKRWIRWWRSNLLGRSELARFSRSNHGDEARLEYFARGMAGVSPSTQQHRKV